MKVILQNDLEKLGKAGDVIKVKDGFARNFLFPRKLAKEATEANLKTVEAIKKAKLSLLEKEKANARLLAEKLAACSFTLTAEATTEDRLYGSIDSLEIIRLLETEGYRVDKKDIVIDEPIKALGVYHVKVKLHPEVETQVKIWVVRK